MITTVSTADLADLLPLLRDYCTFYEAAPSDADLLDMSRELIADPGEGMQLLARADSGEALGFATLLWSWDTTLGGRIGIMHDLFVAAQARGGGTADALIQACTALCDDRGCRMLKWQTAVDNTRAQAVYRRNGAVPTTWVEFVLPR